MPTQTFVYIAPSQVTPSPIQTYTVTTSGTYNLIALGAKGGNAWYNTGVGGSGASIQGVVHLLSGTQIDVVVGGIGQNGAQDAGGGGGGGTFLYESNDILLEAAGGGGGGSDHHNGLSGLAAIGDGASGAVSGGGGSNANALGHSSGGSGGTNGSGGNAGGSNRYWGGTGGAGWLSDGASSVHASWTGGPQGGGSLDLGFVGGSGEDPAQAQWGNIGGAGGFGGGGGGGSITGSGGGGYNGGGGGGDGYGVGGGGSSYIISGATSLISLSGANAGAGYASLTFVAADAGLTTATTISATDTNFAHSQNITLTATETSGATGTITFYSGETQIGSSVTLVNGVASLVLASTSLPTAVDLVYAVYSGDGNNAASESSVLTISNQNASHTTLTETGSPATIGQPIAFSVSESNGTNTAPTGTVAFYDGSTEIGTASLVNGVASYITSSLAIGSHSITAVYGGDTSDAGSTSAVNLVAVTGIQTTTTLTVSSPQVNVGEVVTLSVAESDAVNGIPTGTVTFYDGNTPIGQAIVLDGNGDATITTSSLTAGTHSITADYSGDANDAASNSLATTVTVIAPNTVPSDPTINNINLSNSTLAASTIFTSVSGDYCSVNISSGSGFYGGASALMSISDLVSLSNSALQSTGLQPNGEQVLPEVSLDAGILASFLNPNASSLHYEFVSGLSNGASLSLLNDAIIAPYLTDVAVVNCLANSTATVDLSFFSGIVISGTGVNVTGLTTNNHLIAACNATYTFGAGNQVMDLVGGSAVITGGSGVDTVILQNQLYSPLCINTISNGANTFVQVFTSQGVSTLTNVDYLQFANETIAIDTGIGQNAGEAYRLYQAAFNRTPDQAGLDNWITQLDKGSSLQSIAQSFINSPEFTAAYGSNLSNAAFVNALYSNVLHRAPDAAGNTYWLGQMGSGATQAQVLSLFSESVENAANVATLIGHGVVHQMAA